MVSCSAIWMPLLHGLLKLAGVYPQTVEIEPGTVVHFWAPKETGESKPKTQKQKRAKPAVVFLHGFGLNGIITWQFQVLAVAKEYAVYVPDFIFFGGSTTDKGDRSVGLQAECIAKGLRKLGVEKCTLVGLSYGGIVGFKMAEMYPDLVESMVVTCGVMALTETIGRGVEERLGVPSLPDHLLPVTVQGVKDLFRTITYKFPWMPNCFYRDVLETVLKHRKEKLELIEGLLVKDSDFKIRHYTQKIYLLWGDKDIIYDMEVAGNLKEQLGGKAPLIYIENAGHLVQFERPGAFNSELKKALTALYKGGKDE